MNKQKLITLVTFGVKIAGAITGLAAYADMIPPQYKALGALAFVLASTAKEGLTAINVYLEGPAAVQSPAVQAKLPASLPSVLSVWAIVAVAALGGLGLTACSSIQALDPYAVAGLNDINAATGAALDSGALPSGKVTSIITDVNTISAGLETVLTGKSLTNDQTLAIAKSFKSNSSTTSYMTLAGPIANALVTAVNGTLANGGTPAQAVAVGTQVLVNAPSAVQGAITPSSPSPTTGTLIPYMRSHVVAYDDHASPVYSF